MFRSATNPERQFGQFTSIRSTFTDTGWRLSSTVCTTCVTDATNSCPHSWHFSSAGLRSLLVGISPLQTSNWILDYTKDPQLGDMPPYHFVLNVVGLESQVESRWETGSPRANATRGLEHWRVLLTSFGRGQYSRSRLHRHRVHHRRLERQSP